MAKLQFMLNCGFDPPEKSKKNKNVGKSPNASLASQIRVPSNAKKKRKKQNSEHKCIISHFS